MHTKTLQNEAQWLGKVLESFHLPYEEAEQTEESVHEAYVMADSCDDGLLAVWTDRLHWGRLEHLPLQHSKRSGRA